MEVTAEHLEGWKTWFLQQGHSIPSTMTYYSFIKKFIGDGKVLDQKTIDRFREKNMSSPSAGAIKSLLKYLVRKHNAPEEILNIKFDRNKSIRRLPGTLSVKEVEIIINKMPDKRNKILTIILFELGLRISEAMKLRWEDFNWVDWLSNREGYIGRVAIKNTKRNKFRVLPVKDELMNLLYTEHTKKNSEGIPIGSLVFNFGIEQAVEGNINYESIYDYIRKSSDNYRKLLYKITRQFLGRRINPHMLRHTKAQYLMDKGMPIESLKVFLGHQKISTTEIYAQASPEKVRRDLKSFDIFKKSQEEISIQIPRINNALELEKDKTIQDSKVEQPVSSSAS